MHKKHLVTMRHGRLQPKHMSLQCLLEMSIIQLTGYSVRHDSDPLFGLLNLKSCTFAQK